MPRAWDKLHLAMHCLVQESPQRDRLATAVAEHLACLRPKDLPVEIRTEFANLINGICRNRIQEGASVKAMTDSLTDTQVDAMIKSIIAMYDAVTRYEPISMPGEVP